MDLEKLIDSAPPELATKYRAALELMEASSLLVKNAALSPLERLASAADDTYVARLQRAWAICEGDRGIPRPPLHTWRLMRGKRGRPRYVGYLLEWIDPPDMTGNNVLVLPGIPGAEPVPSRWAVWQEGADLLTSLAIEGALANNETLVVLKTK